ncbi:hypothetical protein P8610_06240 [Fictibacillus sp. UD]|uniref:hypothetical protein n=1 Tax=Fictibacillus sp. UD TaxID=3038777 RepID=UPI0037468C9B
MNESTKKHLLLLYIFLFTALITSPFWVWQVQQSKSLDVLVVDKTIQNESYREHSGLIWALNHLKIQKQNGEQYDEQSDFSRTVPHFTKKELPKLLYVADSYGVEVVDYQNNYRVDGGLTAKEVENVRSTVMSGSTDLIAEFNTFASPTGKEAREGISKLLNVQWTGWIGRYFLDLNGKEVPSWVKSNYKEQYGEWNFKDDGILFAHENGKMLVLDSKDMKQKGTVFSFSKKGEEMYGLDAAVPYHYWFDVISPLNEAEVMANYQLKLTDSGENKLNKYQIPLTFPAVVHHQNTLYSSTYFAGDYADQAELPNLFQTWGLSWIKQHITLDDGQGSTFYWKVYLPLMKSILNGDRISHPIN